MDIASMALYMYVAKLNKYDNYDYLLDRLVKYDSLVNKSLNIDFNERLSIGDNFDILEKGYGNNNCIGIKIPNHSPYNDHNTEVSGVIAGLRSDNSGVYGFSDQIKIMPLTISAEGDDNTILRYCHCTSVNFYHTANHFFIYHWLRGIEQCCFIEGTLGSVDTALCFKRFLKLTLCEFFIYWKAVVARFGFARASFAHA